MEYLAIAILAILFGVYLGNSSIRSAINQGIIDFTYHTKSQVESTEQPRGIPITQIDDDEEYETFEDYINYDKKLKAKDFTIDPKPQKGPTCPWCNESIEAVYKMPGYFFCEKCEKVVPANKKVV